MRSPAPPRSTAGAAPRCPRRVRPPARLAAALAVGALLATACKRDDPPRGTAAGDRPIPGGALVVASAAEPAALLPMLGGPAAAPIAAQIFDRLAEIGPALHTVGDDGFRPRLARAWTWAADSLSVSFALDPRARWHDGRPVTSRDVRFTFDLVTDPRAGSPTAALLADVDSVSTPDSLTAVVWYKRRSAQQFYDVAYNLLVLPEHLLGKVAPDRVAASPFARAPIGSGRFRLVRWTRGSDAVLEAVRDHWRGRPSLDRVTWRFARDAGAATIALLGGDADVLENLRPETIDAVARERSLRVVLYPSLDYGFLQFNLRAGDGSGAAHPLFADRELRRALTMAVDRARAVRTAFDSLATTAAGPVPRAIFPDAAQLAQLPYDVARARALLDSLGWVDTNGDGTRERAGTLLGFTLLVPTTSPVRQRLATSVADQLRAVGARVTVEPLDIGAFVARQEARRFDALVGGWRVDPSPASIRQTWGSVGALAAGGANYGSYLSSAFDAAVDSALGARTPERARFHWRRAYQTILDDAPAIWLFEPRQAIALHRRVRTPALRADAWWAALDEWWIPAGERIGRDR